MSSSDTTVPAPAPDPTQSTINSPNAAVSSAAVPTTDLEPGRRESPWVALRHRDFRLFFSGNFVSQAGSQMQIVAINVQLWDMTHDPLALGLRGLFKLVPLLALSLFGGVLADALDRRRLLLITQSAFGLVSLVMAASTAFGWVSPALIYAMTVAAACTTALDNPARTSITPNLVPRAHLPNALSLNIIVWQIATVVGPAVASPFLGIGQIGFVVLYSIDALSFGAVLVALVLMRTRLAAAPTRDVSIKAAFEGFHFLRRTPIIMSTMSLDFVATFFGAATMLFPAFAETVLRIDRNLWGLLFSAPAVGALVAGVIMSWLGNVRRQGPVVIWSVIAYGLATVLFGLSGDFWVACLALAGTGAADTVSMVMRQTIRQLSTPDELRGRMTSINMVFYMGGPQLGEVEAGLAARMLGIGPSIALGGAAVVLATTAMAARFPSLRRYDRA